MAEKHADPAEATQAQRPLTPSERALDHALEETFPGSDPVSVMIEPPAKSIEAEERERAEALEKIKEERSGL